MILVYSRRSTRSACWHTVRKYIPSLEMILNSQLILTAVIFMLQDESLHVISDSSDDGWSIVQTPGFGNKPSLVPATSTVS